jgi:glucokinase
MRVILIGGLPASGKSVLADRLRMELRWPLLGKDMYKETLFDSLGVRDREWSRRLSAAAYALMFAEASRMADCNINCILEGNFRWLEQRERLLALLASDAQVVQVVCRAEPDVLIERFRARAHSRHPGHADDKGLLDLERELRAGVQAALPLDAPLVECDTTSGDPAGIDLAVRQIRALLRRSRSVARGRRAASARQRAL